MADIQCGDAQIEVYAHNAYDQDVDRTMIKGVTVNITTTGDDGAVKYQTYTINDGVIWKVIISYWFLSFWYVGVFDWCFCCENSLTTTLEMIKI